MFGFGYQCKGHKLQLLDGKCTIMRSEAASSALDFLKDLSENAGGKIFSPSNAHLIFVMHLH